MLYLESIISILAPHNCIQCGHEGSLLCDDCMSKSTAPLPARCYHCNKFSQNNKTCTTCKKVSSLSHVWIYAEYKGIVKELVQLLKFNRARNAANTIADLLQRIQITVPNDVFIVPIPTASNRRRQRGYDQAELIAKKFAKAQKCRINNTLLRIGQTRQVGSKRRVRLRQIQNSFIIKQPSLISGKHIILIDDVITTGATIESAAKALRKAGAKRVDALIFARA